MVMLKVCVQVMVTEVVFDIDFRATFREAQAGLAEPGAQGFPFLAQTAVRTLSSYGGQW